MRASQRILLEMSETRQAINSFPDDGEDSKRDELTAQYQAHESRYRAALVTEDAEDAEERASGNVTPERAEILRLVQRAHISDYLAEAEGGPTVTGAALELRRATMGNDEHRTYMPLEMLEQRADAVTTIATAIQDTQFPIAPRVFARSAMEFLGVSTPSVPVGTVSYPILNAGTTADIRSDGVELDGTAATLENKQINPIRLTASYRYGLETLQRVAGFEEALRMDVESVLMEKRDSLGINGQAVAANVSPVFNGLLNSITKPADPTAVTTATRYLAAFDAHVDGKYAMTGDDVRMLVGSDVYRHARTLSVTTNVLLRDYLPANRFRVSANLAAADANIAQAISFASGAPARGFILPTWAGLELISDPYTHAKSGERQLTAIMFVGAILADANPYKRASFKIA